MAQIVLHRIGVQHSPKALVLFYSLGEGEDAPCRKRLMPLRKLTSLGVDACGLLDEEEPEGGEGPSEGPSAEPSAGPSAGPMDLT